MRSAFPTSGQKFVESTVSSVNQRTLLINLLPHVLSSQCISHKTAFFLPPCVSNTDANNRAISLSWQLQLSSAVTPPFSNSAPCFVWVQGQRGSALVSLAHSETLAWPPPNSGSQSLPLVLLVQTQSLVFDIIFFPPSERFREERESLCSMVVWCELLLPFSRVQPWSGLHVSERKSPGVEGVWVVGFAAV